MLSKAGLDLISGHLAICSIRYTFPGSAASQTRMPQSLNFFGSSAIRKRSLALTRYHLACIPGILFHKNPVCMQINNSVQWESCHNYRSVPILLLFQTALA